jgi:hypothetical protein
MISIPAWSQESFGLRNDCVLIRASKCVMRSTPKQRDLRFVHGGDQNARSAAEVRIRAQVIAEYAERLVAAGVWGRFWLRREIAREVEIRLRKVAPPGACY